MPDKLKIIVVDDHSVTVEGMVAIVEKIDFVDVVGTANSGKEALDIINSQKIDVLITDVQMDDINGVELSKIVKKNFPGIKIIAITQHRERWIISKLINLKIDAIVLKSKIDHNELILAIRNIVGGKKYYSPEIAELFFNKESVENEVPYLTMREKEILTLICHESTTKEISSKLSITNSTVETHRKNLFVKLKVKSQSGLVREAIKLGFYDFE
jgi:DNA-binding NarL/FixJ family response regulator